MKITGNSAKSIHEFAVTFIAVIWIVLAPVLWLMAAISTVKSGVTYILQLAAFSAVAVAAVVFGVATLLRRSWGAVGLIALSWLGAAFFFGAAVLSLLWPFMPWSSVNPGGLASLPMASMLALAIAPWGIPFLLMARSLARLRREPPEKTVPKDA